MHKTPDGSEITKQFLRSFLIRWVHERDSPDWARVNMIERLIGGMYDRRFSKFPPSNGNLAVRRAAAVARTTGAHVLGLIIRRRRVQRNRRVPRARFVQKLLILWQRATHSLAMHQAAILEKTSALPPRSLRAPSDVRLAHELFGANCGPAALAAALSVQVCDVMVLFEQFPDRPYTNLSKMREVLSDLGLCFDERSRMPGFGLALIQIDGPWTDLPGSSRWSARHTHWVAVSGDKIYDINAGDWVSRSDWEATTLPLLISTYSRATGWRVKRGLEILEQDFSPAVVLPGYCFGHRRGGGAPTALARTHCDRVAAPDRQFEWRG